MYSVFLATVANEVGVEQRRMKYSSTACLLGSPVRFTIVRATSSDFACKKIAQYVYLTVETPVQSLFVHFILHAGQASSLSL